MKSAVIFLIGVVFGAAGLASLPVRPYWTNAFVVAVNNQDAMTVKPSGKIEFGPAYSADTLHRLLEGLKSVRSGFVDCHETGYRFPLGDPAARGVIRIYPGTADPPPPRLASDL